MESDLAGTTHGISECFAPGPDRGRLIEVERVSRYLWASQMASDQVVLDAGCGTGYGSRMLAEGGARQVIGVDIDQSVVDSIGPTMPSRVRLQAGDLHRLDLDDDMFGLVVCFEVMEHFEDPLTVLDEFVRVLEPTGLLLLSPANRELTEALTARLANVELLRQSNYIVSALLADPAYEVANAEPLADLALRKLEGATPGEATCTVAMASDAALPPVRQLGAMAGPIHVDELTARLGERDRLATLLVDAEQRLASIPDLKLRITDLEHELADARSMEEAARREAWELDQMLMYGRRALSYVRPLIKPLRKARRRLRS